MWQYFLQFQGAARRSAEPKNIFAFFCLFPMGLLFFQILGQSLFLTNPALSNDYSIILDNMLRGKITTMLGILKN